MSFLAKFRHCDCNSQSDNTVEPFNADTFGTRLKCPDYRGVHISVIFTETCYIHLYLIVQSFYLKMMQHWANEREFYIGGSTLLCQFIEPLTFAHCVFIFALRNIALRGYLDTLETFRTFTA